MSFKVGYACRTLLSQMYVVDVKLSYLNLEKNKKLKIRTSKYTYFLSEIDLDVKADNSQLRCKLNV